MSEVRDQDSALGFTDPIASLRAALTGRYEIERQIGQGAFATVYLARDLKHERKVAIKVLNADPESETGEIRFIREIRVVARLQHPNILPLHDSGHVEALLYYVMPYVMGETLRTRMHRERQMVVEAACGIARETADALAYAHSQGIVHRDIKPENILLSGGHAIVADFGIARAIDVGGVRQLTMTGVAGPGTPAYMSPEQLLGDRAVDARSDIYSLGCVLYEMLAGKPPFPGKDGFVKRFTEPPAHITSLRRDAPPWLDPVIAQALARDPSDRYATAAHFVAALSSPITPARPPRRETFHRNALASPPLFESDPIEAREFAVAFPHEYPSPGMPARTPSQELPALSGNRWVRVVRGNPLGAAVVSLVLLAFVGGLAAASRSGSLPAVFGAGDDVDSTKFVVLAAPGPPQAFYDVAAGVADSLYDAFTRWNGLPIVPDARVSQAIADGAADPTTEANAISLARRLGAGKAVWIQATGSPQTPRIRLHLYDARSAESLDEFGLPATRGEQFFAEAAQRLLGFADRPPGADGCDGRTRSYEAWSACSRGHIALARWDLTGAERYFRSAVGADERYAPARLWLAQVVAWRAPAQRTEAHELVRRAIDSKTLSPRDALVATGLASFFEQRFPHACIAYTKLAQSDSLDFAGWYGLGECQSFDSTVVKSSSSPSGLAFRSSWHSAVGAYMTALSIQPGAHEIFAASRLQVLMPVSPTVTRTGVGTAPIRVLYRAFPSLDAGDTVGFVPYTIRAFAVLPRTSATDAALRKNATLLYEFTTNWASRFPRSPRAQEALADALEARGDVGTGPPRASAALRAVDSAIALVSKTGERSANAGDVTRLRARKIRLHFKRAEFREARVLADSLLHQPAVSGAEKDLQWVAALTGRADLAAEYWERTLTTETMTGGAVAPAVANAASKYFAYAALGICGPPLSETRARLMVALRDYVTPDIRDSVRSDLADRAEFLSAPCGAARSGETARPLNKMRSAQQSFARGDTARARELLAELAVTRRSRRPGDISADHFFQDAWLRTQVGDTATAEAFLDAGLGALPTFGAATIRDLAGAASFGRAIVLRAEIAAKRGDLRTARRWAAAIADLWKSADAPLRRVADDLQRSMGSRAAD